jgi:hypothetical protein
MVVIIYNANVFFPYFYHVASTTVPLRKGRPLGFTTGFTRTFVALQKLRPRNLVTFTCLGSQIYILASLPYVIGALMFVYA